MYAADVLLPYAIVLLHLTCLSQPSLGYCLPSITEKCALICPVSPGAKSIAINRQTSNNSRQRLLTLLYSGEFSSPR